MQYIPLNNTEPFKKEKEFQNEIWKLWKERWWWYYKLTDASFWYKPFDCMVASNKWLFCCELKVVTWYTFNLSAIRDNQYTALKKLWELKQNPLIIVYSKKANDYVILTFDDLLNKKSITIFDKI